MKDYFVERWANFMTDKILENKRNIIIFIMVIATYVVLEIATVIMVISVLVMGPSVSNDNSIFPPSAQEMIVMRKTNKNIRTIHHTPPHK